MEEVDVVIVGAGLSGLSAAHHLNKIDSSLNVVVLEAADRVGGRATSVLLKTASGMDRFDLGGQWIGQTQHHLKALLDDLSISIHPQYTNGKKLLQLGDRPRTEYTSSLPTFSRLVSYFDFIQAMLRTEYLVGKCMPEDPFTWGLSEKCDAATVAQFTDKLCFTEEIKLAMEAAFRVVSGSKLDQVSLLYLMMYSATADGFISLLDTEDEGAQHSRITGTAGGVVEKLAEILGSTVVRLNQPVVSVSQIESDSNNNDGAILETSAGLRLKAKRVIMAIPPQHLLWIDFSPPLPPLKQELCKSFPMGNLIKFVATYERPFWREAGYSGEAVCFKTTKENERPTAAFVVYDATTSNDSPALVGFIPNEWSDVPPLERRRAVIHDLASYFGPLAKNFVDYQDKDWSLEKYVGGCPTANLPPGQMAAYIETIRRPLGCIHWAGTETATHWMGYLSGAVQAGHRASKEVLWSLGKGKLSPTDLSDTWYAKDKIEPVRPRSMLRGMSSSKIGYVLLPVGVVFLGLLFRRGYFSSIREYLPNITFLKSW